MVEEHKDRSEKNIRRKNTLSGHLEREEICTM